MAIFAISDLHLALSKEKPMDVFGGKWVGYMDKLKENWHMTVGKEDYVIIPGDVSWATYLEEAGEDFFFIDNLPGKKIISKGNHDYWWNTVSKLEKWVKDNGFTTISFLHNNSYNIENVTICGTRGWNIPDEEDFSGEDTKIYKRELQRLEISLKSADAFEKSADASEKDIIIAAMHFPVFNAKGVPSEFLDIMCRYNVRMCIYGHLHGDAHRYAVEGIVRGIDFRLVAADYLEFTPVRLL